MTTLERANKRITEIENGRISANERKHYETRIKMLERRLDHMRATVDRLYNELQKFRV